MIPATLCNAVAITALVVACERATAPGSNGTVPSLGVVPAPATVGAVSSGESVPSASVSTGTVTDSAPSASAASPPASWSPCRTAIERARDELLERRFSPTQDTARWLRIDDSRPHEVELSIVMRESADGAGTWYSLRVESSGKGSFPWRKSVKKLCCDDHASEEDHLEELRWRRQRGQQGAEVSIAYFATVRDKTYLEERELFVAVAKRAADKCLDDVGGERTSLAR